MRHHIRMGGGTGARTIRMLLVAVVIGAGASHARGESVYEKDVAYALDELPRRCGHFFTLKEIDWPAVSKQFAREARAVTSDQEHLVLLARLVARLKDGHAGVRPLEKGKDVKWPDEPGRTGPGMFWCCIGQRVYVKNSWATAQAAGVRPGMEVLKVNGIPVQAWLEKGMSERADRAGCSTRQQALFSMLHWGLAMPVGMEIKLEVRDLGGAMMGMAVTCQRATYIPWGPACFPPGMRGGSDLRWAKLRSGYGYIHLRRTPGNLPDLVDQALADLGHVPGMILDFRANGGGGFDHDAFMGRFVPRGRMLEVAKRYRSQGAHPYGGPIVVIVDGNTRSAGETGSGIFKEDGRAYFIGESRTAGMSSQKDLIELPSGLFALYVSVRSNMGRFNGGRGLEGIGVEPHEIVSYDPKDLAAGVDTLLRRAEELLGAFPQDKVSYNPREAGWAP